jgi:poly(3-hydroxybutyrate) depolymerase
MITLRHAWMACFAAGVLTACGSDSTTGTGATSTARGTLQDTPPLRIASVNASAFAAQLGATTAGAQLLQVAGVPSCGVDFYSIAFWTVGSAGEPTESSGALMVPTGAAPLCSGPRPILLYAHGTQTDKAFNIADITNPSNTEGALVAAMFAAQGYIVVAPNYAGYDISTLGYHPFLYASQQSGEMIDALTAARTALPTTFAAATRDNGQLFVAGYSEGGHVAMATERALELAGKTVTAAGPMSGPYALEAFGDAVFGGTVNVGGTAFAPLLTTSYQHAYQNLYTATSQVYSATYATGIDTLLPSLTPIDTLFADNALPASALFECTAVAPAPCAFGFGNPYLINLSYQDSYLLDAAGDPDGALTIPLEAGAPLAARPPTQALRKAFYLNDMRNGGWVPGAPTLMCGGDQDPTVFYSVNTGTMAAFWGALSLTAGLINVLDVNAPPSGSYALVQGAFQQSQAAQLAYYQTAAGGGLSLAAATLAIEQNYHASVAPFCALAVRYFFANF